MSLLKYFTFGNTNVYTLNANQQSKSQTGESKWRLVECPNTPAKLDSKTMSKDQKYEDK